MSEQRSTLSLIDRAERARLAGQALVLRGNTGDLFVGTDGSPTWLRYVLASWAASQGRATVYCTPVEGTSLLRRQEHPNPQLTLPACGLDPAVAMEQLIGALRQLPVSEAAVQVIFDWAEHPLPDLPDLSDPGHNRILELLAGFVHDPAIAERGHRLIVIGRVGSIDARLTRLPGFAAFDVPHPNHAERLSFIERLVNNSAGQPLRLESDLTAESFATITGGLDLDDLFRGRQLSLVEGPIGRSWVQTTKIEAFRRRGSDGPVVYEPGAGLAEASGLPQFRYLLDRAKSGRFPRAVLAAGPPGVGKTLLARILGDVLGIPVIGLGNFRSRYVGETERNLSDRLELIESQAPCVLHIDEIDQAIGHRQEGDSADGGTSERALASLMTFLGDRTRSEHVTVFATTNRPDLLDSAMFDRFTIIPVLHPTPIEAAGVLRIAAARQGRKIDEAAAAVVLAESNMLLTGRVLVDVMDEAITAAELDGLTDMVSEHHLRAALADLNMAIDPVEHERLALRAIAMTTFKSYLPWRAARALGEPVYLPPYIQPLLDAGQSELDFDKVTARLAELNSSHGRR